MRQTKVFLQDMGKACLEHKQAVLRLLVVFCLYSAFVFNFSPPFAGLVSAATVQKQAKAGVGGGSFLEKTVAEEEIEAVWSLEAGELEPESFSKPQILLYSSYTVKQNDMIGNLADDFGLSQDTLISINGIKNTRLIQIGQVLRIPNQDGIFYSVKNGDTLDQIAEKYSSDAQAIQLANELFSEAVLAGSTLFIPGGKLDWVERQEINGDLFSWPVSERRITSPYGWRRWPFGGGRQFHSGLDIASPMGAPVRAAMSGRVSTVGWDEVLGNYIVVSHHSGYRTMYAHLSAARVRAGAYVGTGERIGDVGSTGMSTGPHLHFTVFKNGVTVSPRSLLK